MTDTQWPRYEVFQQDHPGRPHENTGSVHAPDPELALQNARDVFVRRPNCHSLWVAPAAAIFSRTAQELADAPLSVDGETAEGPPETYHVFTKSSQRRSMTFVSHVGDITAVSPQQALQRARQRYDDGGVHVWWVCPAGVVTRSAEEDVASMFAPAHDKIYRQPNQYRTVTKMQQIRHADE